MDQIADVVVSDAFTNRNFGHRARFAETVVPWKRPAFAGIFEGSLRPFRLCGLCRSSWAIFGARSPQPKIPFPAARVSSGKRGLFLASKIGGPVRQKTPASNRNYCGFNPSASNCRLHSAGASRSRSTPMPRGKRPSTAALTRSGAPRAGGARVLLFGALQLLRSGTLME